MGFAAHWWKGSCASISKQLGRSTHSCMYLNSKEVVVKFWNSPLQLVSRCLDTTNHPKVSPSLKLCNVLHYNIHSMSTVSAPDLLSAHCITRISIAGSSRGGDSQFTINRYLQLLKKTNKLPYGIIMLHIRSNSISNHLIIHPGQVNGEYVNGGCQWSGPYTVLMKRRRSVIACTTGSVH